MQHFFKTYTICQRYVKFNGTLDAFFNKVGGLLDRTVEWDALTASAAMMAVKISPVPEREVPMRCVLRTRGRFAGFMAEVGNILPLRDAGDNNL